LGYTSVILLHKRGKIAIFKRHVALWNMCLDKGDTAVVQSLKILRVYK